MIEIYHQFELPLINASVVAGSTDGNDIPPTLESGAWSGPEPMNGDQTAATEPTDLEPREIASLLESIHHLLSESKVAQIHQIDQWLIESIELGMTIAKAVAKSSVATSVDRILDLIKTAASDVFDDRLPLTIRVNPQDLDRLKQLEEKASNPIGAQVSLSPDESVPVGDCQITNGKLTVASDLSMQLEEIHRRLVEELSNG